MNKTLVAVINDTFLLWVATFIGLLIAEGLIFTGHDGLGFSVLYTFALYGAILLGVLFFPRQTRKIVSSDWLIEWWVMRHG